MGRGLSLVCFILCTFAIVQAHSSYFELVERPNVTASTCTNLVTGRLHDMVMEPLKSANDLKSLFKYRRRIRFGTLRRNKWRWTYKKSAKILDGMSVTAFFRPKNQRNGIPVSTCCRVPLQHGKCRINVDRAGDFFPGLSYREEWLVSDKPFHSSD